MARKYTKKKADADSLPEGFGEAVAGMSVDDIRKKISDITLLDLAEHKMLSDDGDVNNAKSALKNLMEPYRENFKAYKVQIRFCKQVLDDKNGGATSAKAEEMRDAHKARSTTNLPEAKTDN